MKKTLLGTFIILAGTSVLFPIMFATKFFGVAEYDLTFSSLVIASSIPIGLVFFLFIIVFLGDKK